VRPLVGPRRSRRPLPARRDWTRAGRRVRGRLRACGAALAGLLLAAVVAPPRTPAQTLRAPLQVLAAAPLADALREIDALDCAREPRAELYVADSATVVALALRGERADVVAAGGPAPLGPLVEAGLVEAPRRFATRDGDAFWIAPLRAARDPAAAQALVDAVASPRGRAVLVRRGFAPASE